eukprot:scaffold27660_cov34-Tisochrysis_lutea.AAC.3
MVVRCGQQRQPDTPRGFSITGHEARNRVSSYSQPGNMQHARGRTAQYTCAHLRPQRRFQR